MDSDLIMAVDAKFNSILKEIQQSKLNFVINLTPFSASITLKKSSQVDQNGVQLLPTPPILRLLEQSLNEKQKIIAKFVGKLQVKRICLGPIYKIFTEQRNICFEIVYWFDSFVSMSPFQEMGPKQILLT